MGKGKAPGSPSTSKEKMKAIEFLSSMMGENLISTVAAIKSLGDKYEYQGYDPAHIFDLFVSKAPSHEEAVKDFKELISLFIMRGNKPDKAKSKMSLEGQKQVTALTTRYNIRSGRPTSRDTITLARLAGVTPQIVLMAMQTHKGVIRCPVNTSGQAPLDVFPCLTSPLMASVIPRSQIGTTILVLHFVGSILFNRVINPGKALDPNQVTYTRASYNSTHVSEELRVQICEQLGLITEGKLSVPEPSESVKQIYQKYQSEFVRLVEGYDAKLESYTF